MAWRVLEAVGDGAYADLALERELKRSKLSPRDRGLATELAYGAIRQRRRLDAWLDRLGKVPAAKQPPRLRWLLHVGLQQIWLMDRVPASAAVSTAVELAKRERLQRLAPVVNGVLRAAVRALEAGETLPLPADPKKRLALEHSLPDWLVAELWGQIGPERTEALAAASNRIPPIDLRCNRLRSSREALLEQLPAAALEELPDGLTLTSRPGPLPQLAGFSEGHWCVQDRAAQRIAPLLNPQPGQRVLDACAAPGGKTTHIAELMGDQGEVVAVDVAPRRLQQVKANAERLGLSCIRTEAADATDLTDWEAESFDRVLLDVPCSGLGTLARHVMPAGISRAMASRSWWACSTSCWSKARGCSSPMAGWCMPPAPCIQRRTQAWWRRLWRRTPIGSSCQSPCSCGPILKAAMASLPRCSAAGGELNQIAAAGDAHHGKQHRPQHHGAHMQPPQLGG